MKPIMIHLTALLGLSVSVWACGGDNAAPGAPPHVTCEPGTSHPCHCAATGLSGTQTCSANGDSYSACACATQPVQDAGQDVTQPDATTPLSLVSSTPNDGAKDIPVDQAIRLTFSAPLAPKNITLGSVVVSDGTSDAPGRSFVDENNITFIPALLLPDHDYTVKLTKKLVSADGGALDKDISLTFHTGSGLSNGDPAPGAVPNDLFTKRFVHVDRKIELAVLGWDFLNENKNAVLLDPKTGNLLNPPAQDLFGISTKQAINEIVNNQRKNAVVASFDRDFRDDVSLLLHADKGAGSLVVLLTRDNGWEPNKVPLSLDMGSSTANAHYEYDMKAGDLDGDGFDELIVAAAAGQKAKVWIVDDAVHQFAVLHSLNAVPPSVSVDSVSVAHGNFDTDKREEVAVAYHLAGDSQVFVSLFDDATHQFAELAGGSLTQPLAPLPSSYGAEVGRELLLEAGQLDADATDELVVAQAAFREKDGAVFFSGSFSPIDVDPSNHALHASTGGSIEQYLFQRQSHPYPVNSVARKTWLRIGNFHRDRGDEVFLGLAVFGNALNSTPYKELFHSTKLYARAIVGDVDGDGYDDLVMPGYVNENGIADRAALLSYQEVTHYDIHSGKKKPSTFEWKSFWRPMIPNTDWLDPHAIIVGLDADRDGTVLEQVLDDDGTPQGSKTMSRRLDGTNVPIAALAAPPCSAKIGQDTSACQTALTTKDAQNKLAAADVSVHAHAVVLPKTTPKATDTATLAVQGIVSQVAKLVQRRLPRSGYGPLLDAKNTPIPRAADGNHDVVLMYTVPYDRYFYKVVSVNDAFDHASDAVDTVIAVDIPLRPRPLGVSRAYFNRINGTQWDIGTDVLPSSPGIFPSYLNPSKAHKFSEGMTTLVPVSDGIHVQEGKDTNTTTDFPFDPSVVGTGGLVLTVDAPKRKCKDSVCTLDEGLDRFIPWAETQLNPGTGLTTTVASVPKQFLPENSYIYGPFAVQRMIHVKGDATAPLIVVNYTFAYQGGE